MIGKEDEGEMGKRMGKNLEKLGYEEYSRKDGGGEGKGGEGRKWTVIVVRSFEKQ